MLVLASSSQVSGSHQDLDPELSCPPSAGGIGSGGEKSTRNGLLKGLKLRKSHSGGKKERAELPGAWTTSRTHGRSQSHSGDALGGGGASGQKTGAATDLGQAGRNADLKQFEELFQQYHDFAAPDSGAGASSSSGRYQNPDTSYYDDDRWNGGKPYVLPPPRRPVADTPRGTARAPVPERNPIRPIYHLSEGLPSKSNLNVRVRHQRSSSDSVALSGRSSHVGKPSSAEQYRGFVFDVYSSKPVYRHPDMHMSRNLDTGSFEWVAKDYSSEEEDYGGVTASSADGPGDHQSQAPYPGETDEEDTFEALGPFYGQAYIPIPITPASGSGSGASPSLSSSNPSPSTPQTPSKQRKAFSSLTSLADSLAPSYMSSSPPPSSRSRRSPSPYTPTSTSLSRPRKKSGGSLFSKMSSAFARSSQSLLPMTPINSAPGSPYQKSEPSNGTSPRRIRRRKSTKGSVATASSDIPPSPLPSPYPSRRPTADSANINEDLKTPSSSFFPPRASVDDVKYTDAKLFPFPGVLKRNSGSDKEKGKKRASISFDEASFEEALRKILSQIKSSDPKANSNRSRIQRVFSPSKKDDSGSGLTQFVQLLKYAVSDEKKKCKETIMGLPEREVQKFVDLIQYLLLKNPKLLHSSSSSSTTIGTTSPGSPLTHKVLRLQVRVADARNIFPSSLYIKNVKLQGREPVSGGGFADVFAGQWKGKDVALKRIRVFKGDEGFRAVSSHIYRECLIWQRLQHPYVLPFLGINKESFNGLICLVSPWMQNGTIVQYLNRKELWEGGVLKRMLADIADGLKYLHEEEVVHADLRGANILISDTGTPCLSDFGLTVMADTSLGGHGTSTNTAVAGAVRWMAPEILAPSEFGLDSARKTFKSDVYALGCVAIEIFTRRPPFTELMDAAVVVPIIQGRRPARPATTDDEVWNLVQRCWQQQWHARPSMEEVVKEMKGWNLD